MYVTYSYSEYLTVAPNSLNMNVAIIYVKSTMSLFTIINKSDHKQVKYSEYTVTKHELLST
jgi:hypothetical protein